MGFEVQNLRRRHYVSYRIQGRLLAALILLEVAMVVLAVVYLYGRFDALLEGQLYSVHRAPAGWLASQMLYELVVTVAVMSVVNAIALLVAHLLWQSYVERVLLQFGSQLERMKRLDFRDEGQLDPELHESIAMLARWLQTERGVALELKALVPLLEQAPGMSGDERKALAERLERVGRMLT
ncbi:hypothetical protein [Aestuariirhabdus litorea]|uniref:HAMP domain-containing protein n=1 Tax=Aestuariirhabdus litorea TaxID=2528527 RepID=A0A3P3VRJ6_9GAMM|nr:hypothetical protein [Aestuariirhabdus litorea]RRJ85250.1 hypothetical protein D0544_09345 [Aestuariirhabdus litorea]RWW98472.1 hypothetical protein DZC74_09330 [Endozoicomonadaceae bacterium GTF-13]